MLKQLLFIVFSFTSIGLHAQVLRDLNFRYLYNPNEVFSLTWDVAKQQGGYTVFYELQVNDTTRQLTDVKIQWETRKSTSEKEGLTIIGNVTQLQNTPQLSSGMFSFRAETDQTIVVTKISFTERKKSWVIFYYKKLPVVNTVFARAGQLMVVNNFIVRETPVTFSGFNADSPVQLSYYQDAFPAAAPAFSTAQARVNKTIKPDSLLNINALANTRLSQKGLYLAQQDTASALGVAFRVEDDYPKLGKLESLAEPLIYICTKQEYDKVLLAGNDKKKFDQIILSITGNTERARIFMRNYFKRVELANLYFSSYKEGWKTDRGMMYIIYGIPDEVYLFDGREVWEYKNDYVKQRFQFIKSATLFDPENYVLIRDKKFANDWYTMIDLWRKARF